MTTIHIRGSAYARQFYHATDVHGVGRFSYMGVGSFFTEWAQPTAFDSLDVARTIAMMQETIPLGRIAPYEVLLLDVQLKDAKDVASWNVAGQRFPGFIIVGSNFYEKDVANILVHELVHEIDKAMLADGDRHAFFAMLGQDVGDSSIKTPWWERPQERLAEYIAHAVWHQPYRDHRMVRLTDEQIRLVREWAVKRLGDGPKASILIDGRPYGKRVIEVHALTGETYVDGQVYTWRIPPVNVGGRLMFSGREWTEIVGGDVDYDEKTMLARFTFDTK